MATKGPLSGAESKPTSSPAAHVACHALGFMAAVALKEIDAAGGAQGGPNVKG
jgi:hypothetical protein